VPTLDLCFQFYLEGNWICQLLIEHFNDKSLITQEIDNALCKRKKPIVLFPLKMIEPNENQENSKKWDILTCLPLSYIFGVGAATIGSPQAATPQPKPPGEGNSEEGDRSPKQLQLTWLPLQQCAFPCLE
jgi:hypothetical protein